MSSVSLNGEVPFPCNLNVAPYTKTLFALLGKDPKKIVIFDHVRNGWFQPDIGIIEEIECLFWRTEFNPPREDEKVAIIFNPFSGIVYADEPGYTDEGFEIMIATSV